MSQRLSAKTVNMLARITNTGVFSTGIHATATRAHAKEFEILASSTIPAFSVISVIAEAHHVCTNGAEAITSGNRGIVTTVGVGQPSLVRCPDGVPGSYVGPNFSAGTMIASERAGFVCLSRVSGALAWVVSSTLKQNFVAEVTEGSDEYEGTLTEGAAILLARSGNTLVYATYGQSLPFYSTSITATNAGDIIRLAPIQGVGLRLENPV